MTLRERLSLIIDRPDALLVLGQWRLRLALVAFRERIHDRLFRMDLNRVGPDYWRWRWLRDLVDRVSPFDPWRGYKRVAIRRVLWPLTNPRWTLKRRTLRFAYSLLAKVTPYTGPGKFGGMWAPAAVKAEWLLEHDEYADDTTGDAIDYDRHLSIFRDIDVPWSLEPEHWLLVVDSNGFVYADQYDSEKTVDVAFEEERAEYERTFQPFDEDIAMEQERDALYESQIDRFGR